MSETAAEISVGSFAAAARAATGVAVVIDVFRAFTTAAIALANGARRIVMVDDLDLSVFGDDGEIERVAVPPVRRSPDVDKYGPELKFPNGTQLNANRQPCEGDEEPVYYVGNLHLKNRGILCNRAIPYKRATAAPAPSQEAAA